ADLIRYYVKQMEDNHGFDYVMDKLNPNEHNRSVLRPYGVWAIISPFNFPMALAGGPAGGALVAGNAVVLKPSHQGFFTALKLYECLRDGGLPGGAFHVLTGPGSSVGAALVESRDVDGMTFTGSSPVGLQLYHSFAKDYPKPAICEAGGGTVLRVGYAMGEGDVARGHFVQPTVVEAPREHRGWTEELFVPFVAVASVEAVDEALALANATGSGPTAGFYSEDGAEIG